MSWRARLMMTSHPWCCTDHRALAALVAQEQEQPAPSSSGMFRATPEPWQAEALEAVGRHDRVSIRSGHGVGKTTFESWLILWFLLTHQNCKIPVAANSQDQLRDTIWPEIGKWHRQLPDALKAMIDVQAERVIVVQDPGVHSPSDAPRRRTTPRPCKVSTPSTCCSDRRSVWHPRHRLRGGYGCIVNAWRQGRHGW